MNGDSKTKYISLDKIKITGEMSFTVEDEKLVNWFLDTYIKPRLRDCNKKVRLNDGN